MILIKTKYSLTMTGTVLYTTPAPPCAPHMIPIVLLAQMSRFVVIWMFILVLMWLCCQIYSNIEVESGPGMWPIFRVSICIYWLPWICSRQSYRTMMLRRFWKNDLQFFQGFVLRMLFMPWCLNPRAEVKSCDSWRTLLSEKWRVSFDCRQILYWRICHLFYLSTSAV